MIRKSSATKSNKSNSKSKYCQTGKCSWQLANESIISQWRKQFGRLEQAIIQQASKRLQSQSHLLSMIKHLQQTKKSKIPLRLEASGITRLKSPLKANKCFEESQAVVQNKNILTEAKSEKHEQFEIFEEKTKKLENQLEIMIQKVTILDSLNQKILSFNQQIDSVKSNNNKIQHQIDRQISKLRSQNQSIKSCLLEIKNRVSLQLKEDFQSFAGQIKETIFKVVQILNKKIQSNSESIHQNVKQCLKKMSNIEDSTTLTLQQLEQKVRLASESIIQTKQAIQWTLNGTESIKGFFESSSSFDWNPQSTSMCQKRPNQVMQTLQFVQKRVDGFERRIDLLYEQYLSIPFHRV